MTSNKDLVLGFLERLRTRAIADLHAKDISKGDLNMKSRVDSSGDAGDLTGDSHWYYTIHGRRPGTQPPLEAILEWVRKKPIVADISERSLAFLIARKIGRVGTDIYLGKRPGMALPIIIEEANRDFKQDLKSKLRAEITKDFGDQLRQVFKAT